MKKTFFTLAFAMLCFSNVFAQTKTYGKTYSYTAIVNDIPARVELIDTQEDGAVRFKLVRADGENATEGKGYRYRKSEGDGYLFSMTVEMGRSVFVILRDISKELGQPPMTTLMGNMRPEEDTEDNMRQQIACFKSK